MTLVDNFLYSGNIFTEDERAEIFRFRAVNIAILCASIVSLMYAYKFSTENLYVHYFVVERNILFR